jgi:hypothetical protein
MSDFDDRVTAFFKNYHDRGMKKWAGYFLSDHTVKINKKDAADRVVYPKLTEMSEEEISAILLAAFANHRAVQVQRKEVDEAGNELPFIRGFVEGYTEDGIVIAGESVALAGINHVTLC